MPAHREPPIDHPPPERRPRGDEERAVAPHPDEPRSFDTDAPPGGLTGSAGDPAEGKRD